MLFSSSYLPESEYPCDTEAGLTYLKDLFPVDKFDRNLPPIFLKHQVYNVIYDKTMVDQEIVSSLILLYLLSTSH